jgi:chromosome segregation ATPase
MSERCGGVPDDVDEYNRDERIETIYQGWGAREMAERIVDLEDELGADVDGICTGMHADVAEAQAEIERLGKALKEARADSEYFEEWATANGKRLNATLAQRDEYRDALSEVATYDEWEISAVGQSEPVRLVVTDVRPHADAERDRYRLAWLSARRRAADEANYGMEALDLKAAEIARLTSDRDGWQRGHETAESQLVYERRENARLRAELADLREAIHEES